MFDPECFFCRKLANLDALGPDEFVWNFANSVVLLGPWQYFDGYCLVVLKTHHRELFDLSPEVRRGYYEEMLLTAEAIQRAFSPLKLNYEALGNVTPHLHWHIFPRFIDDPDRLKPVWLRLDAAERDEELRRTMQTGRRLREETIAMIRMELAKSV